VKRKGNVCKLPLERGRLEVVGYEQGEGVLVLGFTVRIKLDLGGCTAREEQEQEKHNFSHKLIKFVKKG